MKPPPQTQETSDSADRLPVNVRLLVASFLLLIAVIGAAIWGEQQVTAYSRAAFDTQRRELETLQMLSQLQDTEIGQRSFLLTDNDDYLTLYHEALSEIAKMRAEFKELTLDEEQGRNRAERLDLLITERLNGLKAGLETHQRGDHQGAVDAMKRGGGKARMDEIRAIVLDINGARSELRAAQQAQLERTIVWVHRTEGAGAILFLLMAIFIYRQSSATLEGQRRVRESQEAALSAATSANRAKSAFLATMSHELRTPMTAIIGMCDLLLAGKQSREERQVTHLLARNAESLLRLLNDILDLSKIEAGHLTFESVDFRLSAILDETEALFGPVASQKGLVLKVAGNRGPKDVFRGDPKRLQQVLVNLVGNAIKFTPSGQVTISNRQSPTEDGPTLIEIEVEDTGEGISDEAMNRLFREFEQEDISTSRRYGGSGLGLNISKRIVEAMGGAIGASSSKGRGSCFYFSLRLLDGDAANVIARRSVSRAEAGQRFGGRALDILFAEDTPATQFLVTRMLSLWGHNVRTAANGEEAVKIANERRWDIILMDMQMPIMDGPQATQLIRKGNGPSADAPIIALTADAVVENRQTYLDAGCNVVATKPINWAELADHMAVLLGLDEVPKGPSPAPSQPEKGIDWRDVPLLNENLLTELKDSLGGDTLSALVTSTVENLRHYVNDLKRQVAVSDLAAAARLAHQIKGAGAQIGAERAAELARLIELRCKANEETSNMAAQLEECLKDSASALEKFFEGEKVL